MLSLFLLSISNNLKSFFDISTLILIPSVFITFFSFYQQIIIAKKWCPICLSIITLIYIEFICLLSFNHFSFTINIKAILLYSLVLITSYMASVFLKRTLKKNIKLESEITKHNRFKRNYELFKMSLLASEKIETDFIYQNKIILGNPDAKLKLILVSSPFCSYCKNAHKIIEEILELHKDKVCIDFHFHFNAEKSNEKSKIIHHELVKIYFKKGQIEFMTQLYNWFENRDESKLTFSTFEEINLDINELLANQFEWNKENNINFTPALIINNYHFPKVYERADLIHFINELEDDHF